jgi:hypothetical protein
MDEGKPVTIRKGVNITKNKLTGEFEGMPE